MARHRSHSIAFKRQVAQEYLSGETLRGLAVRHDLSRNVIRIWVAKYEAGAFDEDADSDGSRPPVPTRSRPAFRFDVGHHSGMKPASR